MTTELSAMEDWDFFLTLLDQGFTGAKIPTEKEAWLFYRLAGSTGVNASVVTPGQRMSLRTKILKRHNLVTRMSWVWNIAAVVFSWLKPIMINREKSRLSALSAVQQKRIKSIIQQAEEVL